MSELIRKRDAIDATTETVFVEYEENADKEESIIRQTKAAIRDRIKALPSVYVPDMNVGKMEPSRESDTEITRCSDDTISRQAAQHKINALIDEFEIIMKDIRERHVDDSVCGLCEYDGAFMSDSGDWCNECPGFERDDCFKLKDQYREEWVGAIKNLPPVQPERIKGHWIEITSRNHTYKCSVCGRLLVNITDGKNNVAKNYPYCHCGADMRGKSDADNN